MLAVFAFAVFKYWGKLPGTEAVVSQEASRAEGASPPDSSASGAAAPSDDPFALALKEIDLSQGSDGFEEWRLKASWASMRKDSDTIFLKNPRVTYFMSDDNGEIVVTSDSGEVNQAKKTVLMRGHVVATRNDAVLETDEMFYESSQRAMFFKEGAAFKGEGMKGSAAHLVWLLDEHVLDASGGVVVDLMINSGGGLFLAGPQASGAQAAEADKNKEQ